MSDIKLIKKPQTPMQLNGEHFYPMTSDSQVVMENGKRLNTLLKENIIYYNDEEKSIEEKFLVDADLFGGQPPEYYLNGSGGGTGGGDLTINLEGTAQSGLPSSVNADLLDGRPAAQYVRKDELDTSNMDLLWENPNSGAEFAAQAINISTITNYKKIKVIIKTMKETYEYYSEIEIPTDMLNKTFIAMSYANEASININNIYIRAITLKSDSVAFGAAYYSGNALNGVMIPYKIYGIKDTVTVSNSSIDEQSFLNKVYPIGSIYMSMADTDPANLFGGTWERIKDTFLLSSGDIYNAGSSGGEAEHTLTIDEMPSHCHTLVYYNNAGAESWGYNYTTGKSQTSSQSTGSGGVGMTGGSQPHNNMPPYLTVHMWQRIS